MTQIYTHIVKRGGQGVISPVDRVESPRPLYEAGESGAVLAV